MSRRNCGSCSGSPCGLCSSNPCSCTPSGCSSSPGCCENVVPPAPAPYYACSNTCVENHNCVEVRASYKASLKVDNSFNMPDCDESIDLKVQGLTSITIGSYLWNPGVGYLEVIAFNAVTGIVSLTNNCTTGNAAAGTQFPACTEFTVAAPPDITGGTNPDGIFVAIDFTAPAVSTCLLITVTEVTGVSAGNNVQIGGATYRVSAVNSATTITICNDGAGLTPGTPVVAKNGSGAYQYPVTLITVNPCDLDAVTSGTVIACDGGVAKPLTGIAAGQVLALQDPETGEAEYITLSVQERTCTLIQCCLTLMPGTVQYIITVADSSEFQVGDVCQIGTRTDRWTIDSIPDATHIVATTDTNPGAVVEIPIGTTFCNIDCCEANADEIEALAEVVACGPQVIIGDIPQLGPTAQAITLVPDGDGGGKYATTISSNVRSIGLPALFPDCDPATVITVKAVLSVATLSTWQPATLTIPDGGGVLPAPLAWYSEIGFAWDIGTFPSGAKSGKIVRTHTIQDGKIGGFPADGLALYGQILSPAPNYPMDYDQVDVEVVSIATAADTVTLSMYYTAILGGAYAVNLATPLDLGDFRYLVTGHVEIYRSA